MERRRLDPEQIQVTTFDTAPLASSTPVTDPDTWEDSCIKMCPTDDTCTMLGCTRALAF